MDFKILKNIDSLQEEQFKLHDFYLKSVTLEDITASFVEHLKSFKFSLKNEKDEEVLVPVVFAHHELWANEKLFSKVLLDEYGQEIIKPIVVITRGEVNRSSNPTRYTIPNRRRFVYLRIPFIENGLKGYEIYKIPQPTLIEVNFNVLFITRYLEDVDKFYELIINRIFSSGQSYFLVNNFYHNSVLNSIDNSAEVFSLSQERLYKVTARVLVLGKLFNASDIQKVKKTTGVVVRLTEK